MHIYIYMYTARTRIPRRICTYTRNNLVRTHILRTNYRALKSAKGDRIWVQMCDEIRLMYMI